MPALAHTAYATNLFYVIFEYGVSASVCAIALIKLFSLTQLTLNDLIIYLRLIGKHIGFIARKVRDNVQLFSVNKTVILELRSVFR